MLSIYQLKPKFQAFLRPYAIYLHDANITANQLTLAACFGSIIVALFVGLLAQYQWIFVLIPLWMFIRMALNAIDGMLAREYHQRSNYVNEYTNPHVKNEQNSLIYDINTDIVLTLRYR
ncbi:CDP-alcohol phosphatidyltransferase family protein [Gilliamella sp. ESL0250]|uniref:CDP-alcohol phosphatidyltransferase family protein n=1 Tax=Gilliamella sp. ESL0250 TaxID=2705036 RepID=UPI0019343ADF